MPLTDLPPQVAVTCDCCHYELEYEGVNLHFDQATAALDIASYEWRVREGRVYCPDCSPSDPEPV
jgi:hypothetical protein